MTHFRQIGEPTDDPVTDYGPVDPLDADPALRLTEQAACLPALRIDCGIDDTFVEDSRILHATLHAAGVHHAYQEFSGARSWDYWNEHLAYAPRFSSPLSPGEFHDQA